MSDQLTRLLNEFDPVAVMAAGVQLNATLYVVAENTVLFWAGLAEALHTFNTEQELEAYYHRRAEVVREDIVDEDELHIDAITLLRGGR